MKTKIGLVFAAGLMLHILSASTVKAEESKKKQAEPARRILQFGNMGGLLPTIAPEDLPDSDSQGARLMSKYCNQCHNLPGPGMHTLREWSKIYWVMYWRMIQTKKNYSNFEAPDYNDGKIMFAYLSQNALKEIRFGDINTSKEGGVEFQSICTQCHQPPAPTQHRKKDWRGVVNRMKGHMASMGKHILTSDEANRIVHYLKSESSD